MFGSSHGLSKMDFVRVLVASLSYLAQSQGDAVGLFALNDHRLHSVYPKVQKQHFNRLLLELTTIENEGKWPIDPMKSRKLHDRTHKELIFFITDMYEDSQELSKFIKRLKTLRNEVVVLHIMGGHEMDFEYTGNVTFEDLETGTRLKVNAADVKKQYLRSLDEMMRKTKDLLLANDISYHLFRLDDHMGEALQLFLKKRSNLL